MNCFLSHLIFIRVAFLYSKNEVNPELDLHDINFEDAN